MQTGTICARVNVRHNVRDRGSTSAETGTASSLVAGSTRCACCSESAQFTPSLSNEWHGAMPYSESRPTIEQSTTTLLPQGAHGVRCSEMWLSQPVTLARVRGCALSSTHQARRHALAAASTRCACCSEKSRCALSSAATMPTRCGGAPAWIATERACIAM